MLCCDRDLCRVYANDAARNIVIKGPKADVRCRKGTHRRGQQEKEGRGKKERVSYFSDR